MEQAHQRGGLQAAALATIDSGRVESWCRLAFNLPAYEHVVYGHQHLEQVICQLRFNPILRIASAPPADFQERISDLYPIVQSQQTAEITFALQGQQVLAQTPVSAAASWRFQSEDGRWTVTLAQDFVALQVARYLDFDEFSERVGRVLSDVADVYDGLDTLTRVGLRYSNAFDAELGSPDEVLNGPILGLMSSDLAPAVQRFRLEYLLRDGDHQITIRLGTGKQPDSGSTFVADFDHFTDERTDVAGVMPLLKQFHDVNYRLFRWVISDALHERMEPKNGD